MTQLEKKYVYDEVLQYTGKNGEMDSALMALEEDLKALYQAVKECEEYYHGVGTTSTIYKQYQGMYYNNGNQSGGFWGIVKAAADLQDLMYTNAYNDQQRDQGLV